MGRDGVVQRALDVLEHLAIGQLGQQAVDRLVQAQLALLDQDHRGGGGDRLGHGGDAEDAVARQLLGLVLVHAAGDLDDGLALAMDQGDDAGKLAGLNRVLGGLMQPLDPAVGQAALGHGFNPGCLRTAAWSRRSRRQVEPRRSRRTRRRRGAFGRTVGCRGLLSASRSLEPFVPFVVPLSRG